MSTYNILDTGACIAEEYDADGGNATALGCSGAWEQLIECEYMACQPTCASNATSYNSCVSAADTGTCATYVTQRQNACAMFANDQRCPVTSNPPTESQFDNVAGVFCGPIMTTTEDTPMFRLLDRQ